MMAQKPKKTQPSTTFIQQTEQTLSRHSTWLLWGAVALYITLSLLTFNLRISEGGDDSTYIIRAYNFLTEGKFPSYQGPLYPLVLSVFIAIAGVKIGMLKITSWLFLSVTLVLFYKAFKSRVSQLALWGTIFALVVNHHLLYFGSQTYSEAFFMMVQGLFLMVLFKVIAQKSAQFGPLNAFYLALLILALSFTRTVGFVALPALLLFLLMRKQYKDAAWTILFFLGSAALFFFIKYLVWDAGPLEGGQATSLLYKHPYDFAQGKETLRGFMSRFAGNSNIYLSKYFLIMTGFKPALSLTKQPIWTTLLYTLFFLGLFRFRKKNPFMFFAGLYLIFMLGTTFFSLQTLWDQRRLIIPFFPIMVLFLAETMVSYTTESERKWQQKIPVFVLSLTIALSLTQTVRQSDFKAVWKNLAGDRYYGYTPDWQNFLKMAEYIGRELPPESFVASRKPNMAQLYANGKKFYGIYRFQSEDPDTLLTQLHDVGVTHVMAGSLRRNPREKSQHIINTIHRYLTIISKKYPKSFILRHQIGKSEPAWLFEVNYNTATENEEVKKNLEPAKNEK